MFLELQWEDLGSSLVAMRTSGNFSCCLRELKLLLCCDGSTGLLEPLQWNQASSRIEGGISCFFFFFELLQEALGSSRVAMGTSGTLSCFVGEVRSAFKLRGAPRDSSVVAAGE